MCVDPKTEWKKHVFLQTPIWMSLVRFHEFVISEKSSLSTAMNDGIVSLITISSCKHRGARFFVNQIRQIIYLLRFRFQ